jgi:hypothetical protein
MKPKKQFVPCSNDDTECPFCKAGFERKIAHIVFIDGRGFITSEETITSLTAPINSVKKKKKPKVKRSMKTKLKQDIMPFGIELLGSCNTQNEPTEFKCYCGLTFRSTINLMSNRRVKSCPKCLTELKSKRATNTDGSISYGGTQYMKLLGNLAQHLRKPIPEVIKYLEKNIDKPTFLK